MSDTDYVKVHSSTVLRVTSGIILIPKPVYSAYTESQADKRNCFSYVPAVGRISIASSHSHNDDRRCVHFNQVTWKSGGSRNYTSRISPGCCELASSRSHGLAGRVTQPRICCPTLCTRLPYIWEPYRSSQRRPFLLFPYLFAHTAKIAQG